MENAQIRYAGRVEPTFENLIADCPWCNATNIFNRASDLRTFEPIGFRAVTCYQCKRPFKINKDMINAAHEMLLLDCFACIERKQYILCVLTAAQAYEVFFNHFMHVQLIYRAYARDVRRDPQHWVSLKKQLYGLVQKRTFEPMRNLFLRLAIDGTAPGSLADAEAAVAALPSKKEAVPKVPEQDIEGISDEHLKGLFRRLSAADINKLRNRVVHKDAHRPTRDEATRVHDEARDILGNLTLRLQLEYDAYWYMSEAGR